MRAAFVQNGAVVKVLEVQSLDFMPGLIASDVANVGDSWDGSRFIKPASPVVVPSSVSRFQALAALSNAGLLSRAQAAVNSATDPLVSLAWNNAQDFRRDSSMIASLAPAIPLTSAQIDALFIAAAQITA